MSVISTAIALQNLKDENVAWKLLRSRNAPMTIAILDSHFTESARRIPVPEFINLVDADLEDIASRTSIEVSRSAQAYCDAWRADGYLVRRPVAQTRQETYELSSGALLAIDYAKRMMRPHRTVTQSRLSIIVDQINSLALATDENEERRRRALLEERDRIEEQLVALEQGHMDVLDRTEAAERVKDIVGLAREIPADFAHVRDDFERINRSLYDTIINYEPGHEDILADIFDGVDEISQSPSGQSFKGFYSLLRDADLTETVQDDIDGILDCDFARELDPEERRFLRGLVRAFVEQGQEVNGVMTSFAQGLRRFVQSQDYQRERVLKRQIDRALGRANRVVEICPCSCRTGQSLELSSVRIMPVSRWKLKNPAETQAAPAACVSADTAETVSFEDLKRIARETEIDFMEIAANVNACVRKLLQDVGAGGSDELACVSVAEVLARYPATQGVASVVGLVALALDQGVSQRGEEIVHWKSAEGDSFRARIPRLAFDREVIV